MVIVHIPWNPKASNIPIWNQITASIMERFGLPGYKYTTEITENYMNFHFQDDHEGLICQLLVSDYI
jgi:hypothetical protein